MSLSASFLQAAYSQETGRTIIGLLTLTHPDLSDTVRISTDPTQRISATASDVIYGTVSRGDNYVFLPVTIKLPDDTEEGLGDMTIELDNINRAYIEAIRSVTSPPPELTVELVLDNALDTVEAQWPAFQMLEIKYNEMTITCTLKLETLEIEPFPAGSFNPSQFPGLH